MQISTWVSSQKLRLISAAVRVNMQFLCCWRLRNLVEELSALLPNRPPKSARPPKSLGAPGPRCSLDRRGQLRARSLTSDIHDKKNAVFEGARVPPVPGFTCRSRTSTRPHCLP